MARRKQNYSIAWNNLLICLRKGYNLKSWIAPIPEQDKQPLIDLGMKHIQTEELLKITL